MSRFLILYMFYFILKYCQCLWNKGVVHYTINKMDYDINSQDIILSTMDKIQKEICVKFFMTPLKSSFGEDDKILFISNSEKQRDCPPQQYDFTKNIVHMKIGYKCLNDIDISRILVDMLRASVEPQVPPNSFDLARKFKENSSQQSSSLLTNLDRNYINQHYQAECNNLIEVRPALRTELSGDSKTFYEDKLWPLAIVLYGADDQLRHTDDFHELQTAMSAIELSSCVVFKEVLSNDVLIPKNFLWFVSANGETMPQLGFFEGNQTLLLSAMVQGTPGHTAHKLNTLMRILGIPMMSNRFDRNNYVTINWNNIQKGMEHYVERMPQEALLKNNDGFEAPYDFTSVTHAPANYLCGDCSLGQQTVTPKWDHYWQRTLAMGHRTDLSAGDIETLNLLYSKPCQDRLFERE